MSYSNEAELDIEGYVKLGDFCIDWLNCDRSEMDMELRMRLGIEIERRYLQLIKQKDIQNGYNTRDKT